MSVRKRVGITAAALGGLAGAAYAAARFGAAHVRRAPDADAERALVRARYLTHDLPAHDGGTIHVVEAGDAAARPIVLSHGVTLSARVWFHQLDELPKQGFRVIAFDHRGHGDSIVGETGHSLENLAADVRTVLTALDLREAVLVGHSMGGVAVQGFVIRFPDVAAERVAGIVLLSTLAYTAFGSRSTRTKARLEALTKRTPDSSFLWKRPNLGLLAARVGFGKDPHPSHVELVRQMMLECPAETRRDAPRTLIGLDYTHDLPNVRMPTLVIGGSADVLTPPFEARRLAKLIPGARVEIMAGGGHMLMLERAEQLNRLITDFAANAREKSTPDVDDSRKFGSA
ncbi:MAG TPA: alpha/beta fold hydrolase [Acidimicrobiia bacterium]|nr:alpha/beta fold hydrolase [Acidimicrobiia bacterium]